MSFGQIEPQTSPIANYKCLCDKITYEGPHAGQWSLNLFARAILSFGHKTLDTSGNEENVPAHLLD
jgi:hypothetical protein